MASNLVGEVAPLVRNHGGAAIPRSTADDDDEWQPVYAPTNTYSTTSSTSNGHRRRGFQNHDTVDHLLPIYGDGDDDDREQDKRSYWNRFKEAIFYWPVARGRAWTANHSSNSAREGSEVDQVCKICSPINREAMENSYYEDTYNGESWSCSFGTEEDVGAT
jgi:hypothetical protein